MKELQAKISNLEQKQSAAGTKVDTTIIKDTVLLPGHR